LAVNALADHLRALLVDHAVLSPRDERLIGLERAINRRIARVDNPTERRILRSYATWRHLRRLRTLADRQPITADQVVYACNTLTAAADLLNWLQERGQTLATCTQDDIDDWLTIDTFSRSRGFITWTVSCRHAHNIQVPPFNNQPVREVFANHDQRWSLARQLLHDDSIALPDRVAGLLVLLYAQRATRITQLTTGNITITDNGVKLLLGKAPITVPEAFGDLLEALVNDRRATTLGSQDEVGLYPTPRLRQPLAPRSLLQRLRALGVPATLGRNTALMEMAGEMPAAVITKLLGISLHRATRWTQDAGNTRPGYAPTPRPTARSDRRRARLNPAGRLYQQPHRRRRDHAAPTANRHRAERSSDTPATQPSDYHPLRSIGHRHTAGHGHPMARRVPHRRVDRPEPCRMDRSRMALRHRRHAHPRLHTP
jgi:hypothetical protein